MTAFGANPKWSTRAKSIVSVEHVSVEHDPHPTIYGGMSHAVAQVSRAR
jgi:hypothetical protein